MLWCWANFNRSCRCLGFSFSMRKITSLPISTTFCPESYPVRKDFNSYQLEMNFFGTFFSDDLFTSYENNKVVLIVLYSLQPRVHQRWPAISSAARILVQRTNSLFCSSTSSIRKVVPFVSDSNMLRWLLGQQADSKEELFVDLCNINLVILHLTVILRFIVQLMERSVPQQPLQSLLDSVSPCESSYD